VQIKDMISGERQFISLEFFPPKERGEWPQFFSTAERLRSVNPLFASVTYGAGGGTGNDTVEIVGRLSREHGMETMAHLTCVGAENCAIQKFLDELLAVDVHNVLALRGDLPKEKTGNHVNTPLLHASDLVAFIRSSHPETGVAVAGYPETHPEADSPERDIEFLRLKIDKGADFIITQLFFDNRLYHDFVRRARAAGVTKPIIPGILPVVSLKVINRIVSLCGATIPPEFMAQLEEADQSGGSSAVQKTGIDFARKQAADLLASGVPGVHLYTLNRAEAVLEIADGLL